MVNKMKLILTLLLLFSLGSYTSINAQQMNRSSAQPGIQNFIIQFGETLELTDQQKSELLTLQVDRRSEMQVDRRNAVQSERRSEMQVDRRSAVQVERQSGRVGQQQRAVRGQQRAIGGHQRGAMRFDANSNRPDRSNRTEIRIEHREAMMDILTDQQKARYYELQAERVESRTEILQLRNRTLVESTIADGNKAEEVIGLLNRITEIQKENQLQRIENVGEIDSEKFVENVAEIRSIQDELMSKITVAEYRTLRPAFAIGQGQRPGGRGTQRNR